MFSRQEKLSFEKVKKKWKFCKGVSRRFLFKKYLFSTFFSCKISQKRLFCGNMDRKEGFLEKKN